MVRVVLGLTVRVCGGGWVEAGAHSIVKRIKGLFYCAFTRSLQSPIRFVHL